MSLVERPIIHYPYLGGSTIGGFTVVVRHVTITLYSSKTGHFVLYAGKSPDSRAARRRAHHSLPQPLHFRVTFEDQEKRTASLRFEQVTELWVMTCIVVHCEYMGMLYSIQWNFRSYTLGAGTLSFIGRLSVLGS